MKQYETFIFTSYSFDQKEGSIELRYSLDGEIDFVEKIILPSGVDSAHSDSPELKEAFFALHLIGGISYFKTCVPKKIKILSGELNVEQAAFWDDVYENGLGEFFFQNQIDFRELINFPCTDSINPELEAGTTSHKVLVPIGGGKDSVVTIEKLRKEGADITLLRMGAHPLIDKMVEEIHLPCLTVERRLDPRLFELNAEGALNGHVPITGYLSALCVVLSKLYGFGSIAMSNEKSANEGNTEYLGKEINHQWSKSEEFEKAFQEYIHTFIDSSLEYKSVLRTMTELQIVKEFAQYPQYFPLVTSCNKNWRILGKDKGNVGAMQRRKGRGNGGAMHPSEASGAWCGTCPKCAFVFALMAAYMPKDTLLHIFGKNLFEDENLIPLYKQLLGIQGFKPFECVGTPEETKEAFALAHARGELDDTAIMQLYLSQS